MKKKILSMLLVACMIVGLLPMVALAADPVPTETKINFNATGGANGVVDATARYYKTTAEGTREAGTEDDWNMKTQMVDGVAVVTLKGAKLGNYDEDNNAFSTSNVLLSGHDEYTDAPVKFVIEADSYFNTSAAAIRGYGSMTSITIECKNDATLYFNSTGAGATIDATGVPVYLINAKIEATRTKTDWVSGAYITCSTLSITNSTVNFKGSVYSSGKPGISTTGDMTVENSTLLCENVRHGNGIVVGGNLLVKNSTVNCPGSRSYTHMMSVAGDCTIEGNSAVTVNGGTESVTVGGNLTVTDSSLNVSSAWAGIISVADTFTAKNSYVELYNNQSEDGGAAFVGALTGGIKFENSTLLVTAIPKNRNAAAFMAMVPTLTYTDGYYIMMGAEMDGSDAAAVTDLEALTTTLAQGYLKITAKEANSWTTEPSIEGWTYGETAKTPVGAAGKGDVVFTYSDAEDGTYTATVPTNAGTYYMKAEVAAGDTYVGLSKVVSFTIAKGGAPAAPTGLTATAGQTLAAVQLPEGWVWVDKTQSVGSVGNNTFKANYTGTNYESATNVDVVIAVAQGAPDTSNPQTGDNTAVLTAITLFALTAMAAAVVVTKKVIVR